MKKGMLKNKLRVFRAMREMTQEDLSQKCGVTRQTIIAVEAGKYAPSVLLALRMAQALGTTVDEIFQLQDKEV